ncbi:MAG: DNA-formamidopyrimidine glycosylase [Mycoplasmataceae bacterium]|nr:DNA-formamidopyrimidine glycosylase [Mycoplasmataceae bacterium]
MPELPEVTTFINNIKKDVLNKIINNVIVYNPKILKNANEVYFTNFFKDEVINDIQRKGKYIIFSLSHNKSFVLHLRMEGKIIFHHHDDKLLNNHNLVTWFFADNNELRYYDTRMFGTMHIYEGDAYLQDKSLKKVGLEPFQKEFNAKYLINAMKSHPKKALKTLLLDQSIIAGIGNIYADEILYACKLNPTLTISELKENDYENLVKYSIKILKNAIDNKGTTIASYVNDSKNHTGNYQNYLKVHQQKDKQCVRCLNKIKKTVVNGRGTYYCETCQGKIKTKVLNKKKQNKITK